MVRMIAYVSNVTYVPQDEKTLALQAAEQAADIYKDRAQGLKGPSRTPQEPEQLEHSNSVQRIAEPQKQAE